MDDEARANGLVRLLSMESATVRAPVDIKTCPASAFQLEPNRGDETKRASPRTGPPASSVSLIYIAREVCLPMDIPTVLLAQSNHSGNQKE